ncbi:Domain of unknown function (DUF1768)-containing protein [uncultured virus]|nr:Domain of unknown function (DUF1768)-containing protein [uncultured virus]
MKQTLQYKFDQNPNLKEKLLTTGSKKLVEHASNDYHYGCGAKRSEALSGQRANGSGKNMLGILLMTL